MIALIGAANEPGYHAVTDRAGTPLNSVVEEIGRFAVAAFPA